MSCSSGGDTDGSGSEHQKPSTTGGTTSSSGGAAAGGATSEVGGAGATPGSGGVAGSGGAQSTGSVGNASGGSTGSTSSSGGSSSGGSSQNPDPGASTIIPDPSWACGKSEGLVPPELGELVFEVTLPTATPLDVGLTQYGERRVIGLQAGAVSGDALDASFLNGGIDFELTLSNGSVELEQVAMLRATDGTLVYMRSCGVAPPGASTVRIVPDFEAPNSSSLSWLNTGQFVGTRSFDAAARKLSLAVYDVSKVTLPASTVTLEDPPGDLDQPWECSTLTGTKGASVFTETVTLGSSLSVGASKRGTRNVIPITGGTVTGQLNGKVVPGGADYQLIGGGTTLDARYTLASNDGEFVVVRNCGPGGALVPLFETRAAGPYAFLNEGHFLSSDPGFASGGVSITFYERN